MSKVEFLIEEIQHLPQNELEILAREIYKRLKHIQEIKVITIDEYDR